MHGHANVHTAIVDHLPHQILKNRYRRWMMGRGMDGMQPALASPGETVVQSGVWRAESMQRWSERVGPPGHVICIEGDPENFKVLEWEKQRRRLTNVTLVERALWRRTEPVTFQTDRVSDYNKLADSKTYSKVEDGANFSEIQVQGDTLDNILKKIEITRVDHITLEISGGELFALEGMSEILRKHGTRIFVRSILLSRETGEPMWPIVREKLWCYGLGVTKGPKEPNRDGCNLYAFNGF